MSHLALMHGLTIQHLRFTVQARESIVFADKPGSALRGALYQALADNFCSEAGDSSTPEHRKRCPVCWLLAAEDEEAQRGRNIPRPLTVEPTLDKLMYHRDELMTFGFSLIGQAQNFFPYVARAVQKMGEMGVGKGRGRFHLMEISEFNGLLDATRVLLDRQVVKPPMLQITAQRVEEMAARLRPDRVTLEILTPLRLTADSQLVKTPEPAVFIARLMERCQHLAEYYGENETRAARETWRETAFALEKQATQLTTAYDDTYWTEAWSGSRRLGRYTPTSGLVGTVRWEGEIAPLLPWLIWGASTHVGKNAVKGYGWYRIVGSF